MFSASVVVLIVTRMVTIPFVQGGLISYSKKSGVDFLLKPITANRQAFPNMCYYQQEQCRRYYSPSWYDFDRFRIKCSGKNCRMNGKCRKKADSRVRLCPSTDECPGGSICLENIDTYIQHCQCPQSYSGHRCEMLLVISGLWVQKFPSPKVVQGLLMRI